MATVNDHYAELLSEVYIWMMGGFDNAIRRNHDFFDEYNIQMVGSGIAIDLGAGCGFQSIPLANMGFDVTAIDTDKGLLEKLEQHKGALTIRTINADLFEFDKYIDGSVELITCMTDTILHLDSKERVELLLEKIVNSLEPQGTLVLTFRDLSHELKECERFIPVRSDSNMIMTCFLEYEKDVVKVHDLVYHNDDGNWTLGKSFYRKLRLSKNWLEEKLASAGFSEVYSTVKQGMTTIIAKTK